MVTRRDSPCNKNALIQLRTLFSGTQALTKAPLRYYSTSNVNLNDLKDLTYKTKYENFKDARTKITQEQREKSGVYCIYNNINGHFYIGSSKNLASRMRNYLNNTFLKNKKNSNMPIVKALLKYGQENFSLYIIEHVKVEELLIRETFFITSLLPYYNVLNQAYSSLGYLHTEETKKLLSELARNRTHSEKTKALIARALTGENNPFYEKSHSKETKLKISETKSKYPVYIYNSYKKLLTILPSVKSLSILIKSNHATIVQVIKLEMLFRGEWYLTNIPYSIEDKPKTPDLDSLDFKQIILEMNNNVHIKRAVFLYDKNLNFIRKYAGVTEAQKDLNISHATIKKNADIQNIYKDYIFSFERLETDLN